MAVNVVAHTNGQMRSKTIGARVVYVQGKCGLLSIFKCGVEFNRAVSGTDIFTCISALEIAEARVCMSSKGTLEE